jgi:hypothetical protein
MKNRIDKLLSRLNLGYQKKKIISYTSRTGWWIVKNE